MGLFVSLLSNVKPFISYGILGAISRFSGVITLPFFIKYLSVESYGIFDYLQAIGNMIFVIFELQIISSFAREYYEFKGRLKELISNVLSIYLISFLIGILSLIMAIILFDLETTFIPIVLNLFPLAIWGVFNIILRFDDNFNFFLKINLIYLILIIIAPVLVVVRFQTYQAIFWGTLFVNLIFSIFSLVYIYRKYGFSFNLSLRVRIFKYSLPLLPAVIAVWGQDSLTKVFTNEFLTPFDLGIVGFAFKLSMVASLLIYAFKMVWVPRSMQMISEMNDDFPLKIRTLMNNYIWGSFGIVLLFLLFQEILFHFSIFEPYKASKSISLFIMFSTLIFGSINILSIGNIIKRNSFNNTKAALGGMVMNLSLTYYFIKNFGMELVFAPHYISSVTVVLLTYKLAQKQHRINYNRANLVLFCSVPIVFYILKRVL